MLDLGRYYARHAAHTYILMYVDMYVVSSSMYMDLFSYDKPYNLNCMWPATRTRTRVLPLVTL